MTTPSTTRLIRKGDVSVPVTVFARAAADPRTTFDVIVPIDLSAIFRADRFFPGVAHVEGQTTPWNRAGVSRTVLFDDGSRATESLTEYVHGHGFAYELTSFTNALARLAIGARGEWSFPPDGPGTTIRWTYEFVPLPGRRAVLAGPFRVLWSRYMQAALHRAVTLVESESATEH